jgi:hypothetical protein
MKKILLFFFATLAALTVAAQKDIINDPNAELRTVAGGFTTIKISGGIDLYLSQAEEEAVAVSANEQRYKDNIKTEVKDGVLRIYYDAEKVWGNFKNKRLRAYVSFKTLEKIQAWGASDVQVSGIITATALEINMSGASDFKGAVKVTDLKIDLSGASDVKISGIASKVTIAASGASDVKGYDLTTDFCTASASGASDINITVNKEIVASASGASDVFYKGDGVMKDIHASGASSVSKKG